MADQRVSGVYHCLIHSFTTTLRDEMETHIRERHRGRMTSDDPDDFYYERGDSYRVFCVSDARARSPGCGFERYLHGEAEAKRLAERHSNNHEAEYEKFEELGGEVS